MSCQHFKHLVFMEAELSLPQGHMTQKQCVLPDVTISNPASSFWIAKAFLQPMLPSPFPLPGTGSIKAQLHQVKAVALYFYAAFCFSDGNSGGLQRGFQGRMQTCSV